MKKCLISWCLLGFAIAAARIARGQTPYEGYDPTPLQFPIARQFEPRPLNITDLLHIRDFHGLSIAPDGGSVAFVLGQASELTNSYQTGLFVMNTQTGSQPISLGTAGSPRWNSGGGWPSDSPQWSPDSRYITYRLKTNDEWQVWRWPREGGAPVQLTNGRYGVVDYQWSSDGQRIIYTVQKPIDQMERQSLQDHGLLYEGWWRSWTCRPVVDLELERRARESEVWIHDLQTDSDHRATADELGFPEDWKNKLGAPMFDTDAKNGIFNPIVEAKISPDGKHAAYVYWASGSARTTTQSELLFSKQLGSSQPATLQGSAYYIRDFWWGPDSGTLFFVTYDGDGRSPKLFEANLDHQSSQLLIRANTGEFLSDFSVDRSMTVAVALREDNKKPAQLVLMNLKSKTARLLADPNPEFKDLILGSVTRLDWQNKFGPSHAYLVLPHDFKRGQRYPLIVTTYRSGDYFLRGGTGDEYPIQVFSSHGFVVLVFDGGKAKNYKVGDFQEAMLNWRAPLGHLRTALEMLERMGIIDNHKRGITGLSWGVEIVDFSISHSNLFQAAIASGGGSRDPYFYYMSGREWQQRFADWGLGGWPKGPSASKWHELGISMNADKVKTPLLMNDVDSEYMSALSDFTALEDLHKPVEMYVYANELHEKMQPKHRYEIYQRNVDWFDFWFHGKEDPDTTKAEQYRRWHKLSKLQEQQETQKRN